jgi:hypothetical protein
MAKLASAGDAAVAVADPLKGWSSDHRGGGGGGGASWANATASASPDHVMASVTSLHHRVMMSSAPLSP